MRRLLTPLEYTRLDDLVEVVFSAAKDAEQAVSAEAPVAAEPEASSDGQEARSTWEFTPSDVIREKRERIIRAMSKAEGIAFVQKGRALFWDPDGRNRLVCTISKRYERPGPLRYWYAYHPAWHDFLLGGERGWFALGCVDLEIAFAIPVAVMRDRLQDLHTTTRPDGRGDYFHIKIVEGRSGALSLQLPRADKDLDLAPYQVTLGMFA